MFFAPVYIPLALSTGTCIWQGDLFYSAGLHRNHVLAKANTGKIGRGFGKNAGEWNGRIEISKEEIPGSKLCMYGYILTYSRLQGNKVPQQRSKCMQERPEGSKLSNHSSSCRRNMKRRCQLDQCRRDRKETNFPTTGRHASDTASGGVS